MIKEYLSQKGLVEKVLTLQEVERKAGEHLNIMMGQTFDYGQPVDLLKYGLLIMNLQDLYREQGIDSTATMILADHFMTDINKEMSKEKAAALGKKRQEFFERVNNNYNGQINLVFSSELKVTEKYEEIFNRLQERRKKDPEFAAAVLESVPLDRRDKPDAFDYPFEELATVVCLDTDIKVGPKYEIKYDIPLRNYSEAMQFKKFFAIHLTNGYPFGQLNKQVDLEYGILPYKISSKKLRKNRIDLGELNQNKANQLIQETNDKAALIHLLTICELAKQRLENKIQPSFYCQKGKSTALKADIQFLRNEAVKQFDRYVVPYFK